MFPPIVHISPNSPLHARGGLLWALEIAVAGVPLSCSLQFKFLQTCRAALCNAICILRPPHLRRSPSPRRRCRSQPWACQGRPQNAIPVCGAASPSQALQVSTVGVPGGVSLAALDRQRTLLAPCTPASVPAPDWAAALRVGGCSSGGGGCSGGGKGGGSSCSGVGCKHVSGCLHSRDDGGSCPAVVALSEPMDVWHFDMQMCVSHRGHRACGCVKA
eukprot:365334-Chlamydomonas_euryale.AAC.4